MAFSTRDPTDPRPEEMAGALVVAVLLHLLLLIPLALWTAVSRAQEIDRPEPIVVQLEPLPPEPAALPVPAAPLAEAPPPEEAAPEEAVPEEPAVEEAEDVSPPLDESLLGWTTSGDRPGEAERPPGEEAERLGLPEPGEGAELPSLEPDAPEPEGPEGEPEPRSLPDEPEVPEPAPDPAPLEERQGAPREDVPGAEPLPPTDEGPAPGETAAPVPLPAPETRPPTRPRDPEPSRETPDARRPGPKPLDPDDYVVGGAFGDIQFESRDYNWNEYSSKVYWAIYRDWLASLYRATRRGAFARDQSLAQLPNLDGEVWIRFTIDRQGNVSGIEIVRPSIVPSLDQASSSALAGVVLPRLPDDFPRESERVTFRFRIGGFPDEGTLKRSLYLEKVRGRF